MPDADTSTPGRAAIFARAWMSDRVVSTRLERKRRLRSGVHRPWATDAPAKLTTASAPAAATPSSPVIGSQLTSDPSGLRTGPAEPSGRISRHAVCPARFSSLTSDDPTSPVEPVIRTFMGFLAPFAGDNPAH